MVPFMLRAKLNFSLKQGMRPEAATVLPSWSGKPPTPHNPIRGRERDAPEALNHRESSSISLGAGFYLQCQEAISITTGITNGSVLRGILRNLHVSLMVGVFPLGISMPLPDTGGPPARHEPSHLSLPTCERSGRKTFT